MDTFYEEDILGEGFQRATISLRDDYEGRAIATLVRRLSDRETVGRCFIFTVLMTISSNGKWLAVLTSRDFIFTRWIYENTGVRG